ncbi:Tubulin-tyrosine ligase [Parelaphostrongylus tenuis]|uniref:Tubulin-tyrosine ligase n=1 Tax=Parelaphostrongylus tenuis TaxID=148309 RepID=A0AAD5N9W4_PARTN|nr:Tubulin-tyrosine ligase [Parelaphostrongylus tenuis]
MVYIFMQYANLRLSTTISVQSLKRVIKDCGLQPYFKENEVEKKIEEISHRFNGYMDIKSLSFHGFFSFMIFVANRRFDKEPTLQDRLTSLIKTCIGALRNKGVRSRRLRREEVHEGFGGGKKIYMLPSRTYKHRSKSCGPIKIGYQNVDRNADRNNNKNSIIFPQIIQK